MVVRTFEEIFAIQNNFISVNTMQYISILLGENLKKIGQVVCKICCHKHKAITWKHEMSENEAKV